VSETEADTAEKVRDFSALMGTLSLDPDGLLADSCWSSLDHLTDGELKALVDLLAERRKSVPLAEIFNPTIESAAMVRASSLFHERKRARRCKAQADKSALWRESNGALAPLALTAEEAITPETEEESRPLSKLEKDALRKRKAYHAKRAIDRPRLAAIEKRRLLLKLKARLTLMHFDDLVYLDQQLDSDPLMNASPRPSA
jgi:hypothetical protein